MAIGLLTFMLIAGIIGFIILKSRVVNRRQRLSDNQELTLQGPMIEVVSIKTKLGMPLKMGSLFMMFS